MHIKYVKNFLNAFFIAGVSRLIEKSTAKIKSRSDFTYQIFLLKWSDWVREIHQLFSLIGIYRWKFL